MILGVEVGGRDGGLRRLPAVDGFELGAIGAGGGGEEGVCVGDELGVRVRVGQRGGGEEEDEERGWCEHGGFLVGRAKMRGIVGGEREREKERKRETRGEISQIINERKTVVGEVKRKMERLCDGRICDRGYKSAGETDF